MPAIVLHGDLQRFGGQFDFDVATPTEAVRALCRQIKGFRRRLGEGYFRVIRKVADDARDLSENTLDTLLGKTHELHFVPVVAGSKGGSGKAIMGLAIVAAAFTFGAGAYIAAGDMALAGTAMSAEAFSIAGFSVSFAQIAGFGAAMMLGGIAQMLSPTPTAPGSTTADANASFVFNGPTNVSEQGVPVPLVYGRFCANTIVGSSDMTVEQI